MTVAEELELLGIEIGSEIDHLRQLKQQVDEAKLRLPEELDTYDLRSIAMLLTEIYLSAENLMKQIAKRLGEDIPTGGAWHQQLLTQFSTEAPNLRPALFSPQTVKALDGFRRFRHVTHHVYAIQFDWMQMSPLLAQANAVLDEMITDTKSFKTFLSLTNDSEE